jgi:hypothetical protein
MFLTMSTWDYSAVKVFHYEPQVQYLSTTHLLVNLSILDTMCLTMSTWDYSAVKAFHYEPQVNTLAPPTCW